MSPEWHDLHWGAPWFAPVAGAGVRVSGQVSLGASVAQALNMAGIAPLRFVPQSDLPDGTAYEQHIFDTGCVPTRDGLHDFFNGLCWMRFPLTKRQLNLLQAAEIAKAGGVGQLRGPVRDALTLFDENAALFQAPQPLWDALLARDWRRLFVDLRPLWSEARLVLVGHALMEKLVTPYKSITAHVLRAPVPVGLGGDLDAWDAWLAGQLNAEVLATKPFTPLPVLGVPGWWPANEDADFYNDATVFRPVRTQG
ncbi:hypothetical protein LPB72_12745 [Hydrogenophaga crassostreae]|uniref:DUF3025 domain-containing protein n=1 Tax=Hydrogenophaga crassostreae TaxID=1763535 RepID=A0A167HNT2_9BURK|nr:DUF3025 domain-containing protein [Hydrogenophaga crassostreae]AOW14940.1 hypothetical protein LPB072_21075 [Hydrogenophaga crassostreae]OAD41507.1 hypothetical protein LPB72_12745 [Hydrogenophaga crassostreae]